MVPHALPEQPDPLTLHVTAWFVEPETVTPNCCCCPTVTMALVGDMVTETGRITVTVAEAAVSPSALAVAVTVTCGGLGTTLGAVYSPVEETVPHAAPEQPAPVTLHVTPVVVVFVT